jgi:cytochrome c-type biogenesis protein CcmH
MPARASAARLALRAAPAALALAFLLALGPAAAIGLDEILPDPAQEARAREISKELRCVVCQSESIDDSNAEIARDLRLLVRERITAGDSDEEVLAYVVDRYGEFVLFRPPMSAANAPLWLAGPVFLIFGAALVAAILRRRAREAARPRSGLSPEEQARIDALLRD